MTAPVIIEPTAIEPTAIEPTAIEANPMFMDEEAVLAAQNFLWTRARSSPRRKHSSSTDKVWRSQSCCRTVLLHGPLRRWCGQVGEGAVPEDRRWL